jgi:hypothetical protein
MNTERAEVPNASRIMHEDNASAYSATVLTFLVRQIKGGTRLLGSTSIQRKLIP